MRNQKQKSIFLLLLKCRKPPGVSSPFVLPCCDLHSAQWRFTDVWCCFQGNRTYKSAADLPTPAHLLFTGPLCLDLEVGEVRPWCLWFFFTCVNAKTSLRISSLCTWGCFKWCCTCADDLNDLMCWDISKSIYHTERNPAVSIHWGSGEAQMEQIAFVSYYFFFPMKKN